MVFEFDTFLGSSGFTGAVLIPEDIAGQLALDKIKRVVAQISSGENHLTLYAGITKRQGTIYLMFSKANQKKLKVSQGDALDVILQEDTSKYQAPMTEELEAVLLSDYEAYTIFENLLPGKQRNIIFMIYNLKDSQKKVDTALNVMENLKMGNHNPMKFDKLL
ncbi:YdeI/OmpD-associated family protein [Nonlabens sp. Ci31]|uniref:YdeI/OmpD-associated family protein n=1 Tax=Nonlabens sp. Ci31 TaxID=2608253 RepID=UPI001462E1B4|nr:YdeI/OmpD-associated family protein [Nonlabens sp. Ci31]QJP35608.1 YdeI/OmpD-associated family protein [Nonlabens sp. Ci31]